MRKGKLFIVTLMVIALLPCANGQVFNAKLIGGFNASQLEGDNLSGFDKVGLQAGIAIQYELYRPPAGHGGNRQAGAGKSLIIELLFNQKGSSSTFSLSSGEERQQTNLNYLQIPVLFSFDQWYEEDEVYYRISLEGGPYYARLFEVHSSHAVFTGLTDSFRKNDFGAVIGVKYRFQYTWSVGARYDHSFLRVFKDPNSGLRGLLSYLISLRVEYHF